MRHPTLTAILHERPIGLRRGEAAGLCWPDLDLDEATLTISRTLQEHVGRPILLPPKTAASARTLALDHSTVAVLTAHRAAQSAAAGVDRPQGFVFAHRDGWPCSPNYLTHHFRALHELHGLPPIRFHDLRHGAATLGLAAGADPPGRAAGPPRRAAGGFGLTTDPPVART